MTDKKVGAWESTPQSSGGWEDVPSSKKSAPEPETRDSFDVGKIGKETGIGTVAGAFAPELLQVGGAGVSMIPGGALIGIPMMEAGTALRGARLASSIAGGVGSLAGETGGQAVEMTEGPGMKAEAARVLGSVLAPEPLQFLGSKAGKGISTLLSGFVPGMGKAKTLGQLMQEGGIDTANLSAEQIKFLEKKLADIRGGQPSLEAQKEIANFLKGGAQRAVQRGEMSASQIQQSAQTQAQQIIRNAQERANKIRESARASSPQMRQISEADAQAVLRQGQAEAQRIQQEATKRVGELRGKAGTLTERAAAGEQAGRQALKQVGTPQSPTQTGTSIRDAVMPVLEKLKLTRSQNAERLKGEAFSEALEKEKVGQKVADTAAFKEAMTSIQNAMNNPETKLTNVSVDSVRNQLQQVKRALDPREEIEGVVVGRPASFEALENLRRFLRDRSYGLPAEGFDAIGQQQAGKLADAVEKIQLEFSPKIGKFLEQYRKDSEPLRAFKTKLGESIVGKEEFDMARFATDPASLGEKLFKSETGVRDLINLMGGDAAKAEQIARSFVASKLENATPKQVADFVAKRENKDWLTQFPALNQQLQAASAQMGRAERFGGARTKLADVLRTEAGRLPITAEQQAEATLTKAGKEAKKAAELRIKGAATGLRGEKKLAADVVKGAEAEAGEVTKAAEKSAEQIRKEAQDLAKLLTANDTSGPERVRSLILGKNDRELEEAASVIMASPGGREKFADAVRQVIAERASSSFKGAIEDWRYISDRLVSRGLLDKSEANRIATKLQEAFVAPVSEMSKASFLDRVVRQAIISPAGGPIEEE